jgi:transposase
MALGTRRRQRQQDLWVHYSELPRSASHPFYEKLNQILDDEGFDAYVEDLCQRFYAPVMGRPSISPGVYFRALFAGFFEGLDSERQIAWRLSDSLSLRRFVGVALDESAPHHSSLSRTRRLIDLETHRAVFTWVLKVLARHKMLRGSTLAIDATTLEANAALRSIVRRLTGESYQDFLKKLAAESGIETPTREQLAKLDRDRKNKGSNEDWVNPHDRDAKIAKMKDGRTHLAHKSEHAVDTETGAIVAVTLQAADLGDTQTLGQTLSEAAAQLAAVAQDPASNDELAPGGIEELVADKGYHSQQVLEDLEKFGVRSYVASPERPKRKRKASAGGKCKGKGKRRGRKKRAKMTPQVRANRRRARGRRGKRLQRQRGERVERPFAHLFETGGMRRVHLRGRGNISKRLLIHTAGFNLSLLLRSLCGTGKPRQMRDLRATGKPEKATAGASQADSGPQESRPSLWERFVRRILAPWCGKRRICFPRLFPCYAVHATTAV